MIIFKTTNYKHYANTPSIQNAHEIISNYKKYFKAISLRILFHKNICNVCKNQTHSKRLNRVSKTFAIKL